jgi:hypothetical protein
MASYSGKSFSARWWAEHRQLAAGAVDRVAGGRQLARRDGLQAREPALDLVGERDHRIEPHHLDGTGRLVHVGLRVPQRRGIRRVGAKRRERLLSAREHLPDLGVDPGQRPDIKFRCGIDRHVHRSSSPVPSP